MDMNNAHKYKQSIRLENVVFKYNLSVLSFFAIHTFLYFSPLYDIREMERGLSFY
jgi:hypothetical protein